MAGNALTWFVTSTSMSPSISFSFHPFADVPRAFLKLHAIRFAMQEKLHYFAIDYANVFQIQNDVAVIRLAFKESPQLSYRLSFDSATQDECRESPSRLGLNPKSHCLVHLPTLPSLLCRPAFVPSEHSITSSATEYPIGIH